MLTKLASHNDDIHRLVEKGYAIGTAGPHLIVRDVPYLDSDKQLQRGTLVSKLEYIDQNHVKQTNHEIYFTGGAPCGLDGQAIPNLGGGAISFDVGKSDIVIVRSFSNKPTEGFPDHFAKIEHYVTVIAGPAIELHGATALTKRIDTEDVVDSVFKYPDTLTSRAGIADLNARLANDVVAVVGLGGTGSYLLDFLVKAPVKEIRGFDGDAFHVHNAFRSPGRLDDGDLGLSKADVYRRRYDSFRCNLNLQYKYIDHSCSADLEGVTFAFVCVDKGCARAEIFDLLISLGIPFIDVGMGLDRKQDALAGQIRTTYFAPESATIVRDRGLVPMSDDPNDIYRSNVQIAELNALNACYAVIRFKQLRGVYVDECSAHQTLFGIANMKTFLETEL